MKKVKHEDGEIFGIIGLGRFGSSLAVSLANAGLDVIVIDRDEAAVRRVRDHVQSAYLCDELTTDNLMEAGMQNCDVVVVCIGSHIDVIVLTTLRVVSMGIKRVISKAINEEHGEILEKIGAEVVYPEHDMALRLAQRRSSHSVIDYINLSVDIEIAEFVASDDLVGRSVIELDLRRRISLNIIAIQHGGTTTISIEPGYRIETGDILVVIGRSGDIDRFRESH